MKKLLIFCFVFLHWFISIQAENYLVMSDDERILSEKDAHEVRSIASITKIMTALVCLENSELTEVWTVGEEVTTADEKRIYLVEGQEVSMFSLLHGLMLESGNDAAVVLAHHVAGSVEKFVEMMNEKAKQIGMSNTTFHNPHGLDVHQQGNYSTCYDMALLMNEALKNSTFCQIIQTLEYKSEWGSVFHNSNRLLKEFAFCLGGKTGYTSKAGRTLVTAAKKNDLTIICVTFNLQEHFDFHKAQYIQAFDTMKKQVLLEKGIVQINGIEVMIDEEMSVTCTDDELKSAVIRTEIDEKTNEFIIQFELDDYVVLKSYPIQQKRRFCLWRWCF